MTWVVTGLFAVLVAAGVVIGWRVTRGQELKTVLADAAASEQALRDAFAYADAVFDQAFGFAACGHCRSVWDGNADRMVTYPCGEHAAEYEALPDARGRHHRPDIIYLADRRPAP